MRPVTRNAVAQIASAQTAAQSAAAPTASAQPASPSQSSVTPDRSQTAASRAGVAPAPWFGVTPPKGLGDPHTAILDVSGKTPSRAVVPAGEESFRELEGVTIHRHLEAIVGFSRADRARGKAWGRITGFPAADATHDWVRQQILRLAGGAGELARKEVT